MHYFGGHRALFRLPLLAVSLSIVLSGCGANDFDPLTTIRAQLFRQNGQQPAAKAHWQLLTANESVEEYLNQQIESELSDARWSVSRHEEGSVFRLSYEGLVTCHGEVRATQLNSGVNSLLMHLPSAQFRLVSERNIETEWALAQIAKAMIKLELGKVERTFEVLESEDCLYIDSESQGFLARRITFTWNDLTYSALVTADDVIKIEPKFFDATGTSRVYEYNPLGSLKDFTLTGLVENGTLENQYFTTSTPNERAKETDYKFIYDVDDTKFDETSVFTHASVHLEFLRGIGFKWYGSDKLNLIVHAIIDDGPNGALYTPAVGTRPPKIQVGDGDGYILKNLTKDADVVRHELGHHAVFKTLKSVSGESLVIHEGLADYFAFAISGNACLGESICPAGSPIRCEKEKQCLRSGENDYILGVNDKPEHHFKSQFISGMLWDLRKDIGGEVWDKTVFSGISMLLKESGYHDLVLSLVIADLELNDGKHCNTIYNKAVDRGLAEYISSFNCSDKRPSRSLLDNSGSGETSNTTSRNRKKNSMFGCGVVGGLAADIPLAQSILILCGLLVPLLVRRRQ